MGPARGAARLSLFVAALALFGAPHAYANHSFDVNPASIQACLDGVSFTGQPSAAGSLNLPLTPRAGVPTIVGGVVVATTPVASGAPLSFNAIGQTQNFSVAYANGSFAAGAPIVIGVTDSPLDPVISDGTQGWASHTALLALTVGNCVLGLAPAGAGVAAIPVATPAILILLVLALAGLGAGALARRAK